MPDDTPLRELDRHILRAAHELEALGVNVLGFLEQAIDGEKRAQFRARLFGLESAGVIRPSDYERRRLRHFADELQRDLESSYLLFAPSLLWSLAHLRRELWSGDEAKARERDVRAALALVADALADRRTGTHGRPKPGGVKQRERDDALLVGLLARIAEVAVDELTKAKARREETTAYYVARLRHLDFWERVDATIRFDAERPTSRAFRVAYAKHRLEHDLFDPCAFLRERSMEERGLLPPATPAEAARRRERPALGIVVAAMAAVLMGGDVDPAIFGGRPDPDARATARSLALRALRKVCPENLRIPKR